MIFPAFRRATRGKILPAPAYCRPTGGKIPPAPACCRPTRGKIPPAPMCCQPTRGKIPPAPACCRPTRNSLPLLSASLSAHRADLCRVYNRKGRHGCLPLPLLVVIYAILQRISIRIDCRSGACCPPDGRIIRILVCHFGEVLRVIGQFATRVEHTLLEYHVRCRHERQFAIEIFYQTACFAIDFIRVHDVHVHELLVEDEFQLLFRSRQAGKIVGCDFLVVCQMVLDVRPVGSLCLFLHIQHARQRRFIVGHRIIRLIIEISRGINGLLDAFFGIDIAKLARPADRSFRQEQIGFRRTHYRELHVEVEVSTAV